MERVDLISSDGTRFSATWMLPETEVSTVALILPGSGNVGIDGDLSGPFLGRGYKQSAAKLSDQLAALLLSKGVASFRYAKRGWDLPEQIQDQTIPRLFDDARAAVREIRHRYPKKKLILFGMGEGALLAMLLAAEAPSIQALYLLSLPSRPIDEILEYQFYKWPLELFQRASHGTEWVSPEILELLGPKGNLPILEAPWQSLSRTPAKGLHFIEELIPSYALHFEAIMKLARGDMAYWYESMKLLPSVSSLLEKTEASAYIYQAARDSQLRANWVIDAFRNSSRRPKITLVEGVGHCFSPFEGELNQIKTSGPFCKDLLDSVEIDIEIETDQKFAGIHVDYERVIVKSSVELSS